MARRPLTASLRPALALLLALLGGCRSGSEEAEERPAPRVEVNARQLAPAEETLVAALAARVQAGLPAAVLDRAVKRTPDLVLLLLRRGDVLGSKEREGLLAAYLRLQGAEESAAAAFVRSEAARLQGAADVAFEEASAGGLEHLRLSLQAEALAAGTSIGVPAHELWLDTIRLAGNWEDARIWRLLIDSAPTVWPSGIEPASLAATHARAAWCALDRGDAIGAFLGYRHALALEPQAADSSEWKLGTARALFELERLGEARMTVAPLTEDPRSTCRRPALALAGAIEAQLMRFSSAAGFLDAALEGDDGWDGAGRAMADRAAIEWLAGRADAALAWVERAALRLDADRDWAGLAVLLANERAWADRNGPRALVEALDMKLRELEREHGVTAD